MTTDVQPNTQIDTMPNFTEATLNSQVPDGPIEEKWDAHRFEMKLINPANKRKFNVIVVGSGLAGASASATMARVRLQYRLFLLPG